MRSLVLVGLSVVIVLLVGVSPVYAEKMENATMEQIIESSVADLALMDEAVKDAPAQNSSSQEAVRKPVKELPTDSPKHTVADFIIHPLIALKPRVTGGDIGKQANQDSSSTSSPWQLFNFSPGQGLGSSVSSLAGTVTGWLGNRIQLSTLVDTPVREATTMPTTTTTARPQIAIRIRQRPSTKKPFTSVDNHNTRPNRKNTRPNIFYVNYLDDSEENFDDYDDYQNLYRNYNNRRKYQEFNYYDDHYDDDDDYEENVNDRRNDGEKQMAEDEEDSQEEIAKPLSEQNIKLQKESQTVNDTKRKHIGNQQEQLQLTEDNQDDKSDEEELKRKKSSSAERLRSEQIAFQRRQENLWKQIRQLSRGQITADSLREPQTINQNKRPQQAPLLLNHNGQIVYVVPDYNVNSHNTQPQVIVPNRRKMRPSQYITIPWSQLGIPVVEQSTISGNKRKTMPTAHNVPLLTEESLLDIFQPARTPSASKPSKTASIISQPVVVETKPKQRPSRLPPASITAIPPALAEQLANENSNESPEEDDDSTQYIIVADESVGKKFTNNAYREILKYFNHNYHTRQGRQGRQGRQLGAGEDGFPTPTELKQQHLIPVKVITEQAHTDKSSATPKSEAPHREVPKSVR